MVKGFYATDKLLKKRYLDKGKTGYLDLAVALSKYKELGGKPIEKVSVFAVDVDSREILGKLGTIKDFMDNNRIDWNMISKFELSKGSYIKYRDKLNWENVSSNPNLNQELIEFIEDYFIFSEIKHNFDRFTDEFILKHKDIDIKTVILDKELSLGLLQSLNEEEKEFYVANGKIKLEQFNYLLKTAIFKKEYYKLVSTNPFADKQILIQNPENIDWENAYDVFKGYSLTSDEFWSIYPYAKGHTVLEFADLRSMYCQLLKTPLEQFDYEQFLLNNHLDSKTLKKSFPCLTKCIEPNKLNLILSIT